MANVRFTQFAFASTGTTTPRTQPDRDAQYIQLEDFGGVGDSSTDNVAAFNAAVAALGTQATVIHLDESKGYAFNSTITLPVNWTIDGHQGALQEPLPGFNSWNSANASAVNYVYFTKNPAVNETITLNGTVVTFVAGVAVGNQVQIAGTMNTTVTNLAAFLNASADAQISKCTYASGNWLTANLQTGGATFAILEMTFDTPGTAGNAFILGTFSNAAPFMKIGSAPSANGAEQSVAAATNTQALRYGGSPTLGGTIILNSGATISYKRGSCIKNAYIVNGAIPAIYAGPVGALANIAAFSGTALTFNTLFTPECAFYNLSIIGFDKAITASTFNRGVMETIKLDCTNGIDVTATTDIFDLTRIRANTFYTSYYNGSLQFVDTTYRMGAFIHIHDGASTPRIYNPFSYGHAIKYLCGNDLEIVWDNPGADGPNTTATTPALLNATVTAGGAGYAAGTTAAFNPTKGEVLYVTVSGGVINGVTTLDPGTWNGTEGVPAVVFSNVGAGVGAAATAAFIKSIAYSTYGTADRFAYNCAGQDVQGISMKFDAVGSHYVNNPIMATSAASSILRGAATQVNTTGIWAQPPVGPMLGRLGPGTASAAMIYFGAGDPNGVVSAGIGSLFLRTDAPSATTGLYVKTSGAGTNTVWTAK